MTGADRGADGTARRPRLQLGLVLGLALAALAVVPGLAEPAAPGPEPARLAWWEPPTAGDVELHLWAAPRCGNEDGWVTQRTAVGRVLVDERPDAVIVRADLRADSSRARDEGPCVATLMPIAVTVRLSGPLGDRPVLDGSCRPAAAPLGPGQPPRACP